MKIVLDTNVYLSNFIFGGLTAQVCTFCFEKCAVFISPFIKDEITEKLAGKFQYPAEKIQFVLQTLALVTRETTPSNSLPDVCRDPDDNAILQLCQFVEADFLITGDKDLLVLENFGKTKILNPRAFFEAV